VAAANHHALCGVMADLLNGDLARASRVIVTGVGHSIGGMIAITQQASHGSFHRLAVLGWANAPMLLGETDPATLAATIRPGYLTTPRAVMRPLFYAPDVPLGLIEADEAIASPTPACLGRDALRPGIVHEAAAAVTCPVFLLQGATDTSSNPHGEPGYFKSSEDISLILPRHTAHCHNFAGSRQLWWDRLDRWIASLPA
jgi:pimeloyl-ACP methyl ester carboxylesterase